MPPTFALTPDPAGLPFGYVPLSSLGVAPSACDNSCDETAITFVTPTFSYAGATYDRATMTTNGYLIVGARNEVRIFNQDLPDPTVPNNLIAPYWADLDLDGSSPTDPGAGAVCRWRRGRPGSPTCLPSGPGAALWAQSGRPYHSFEVWIEGGSDRIHLVYGPNSPTEDRLTSQGRE